MERSEPGVSTLGTVVEWEGAPAAQGSPLEAAIGKEVFYLHDRVPMGVVAEVIRNDMAEPLGIVVYDEASKEVQRFKESQVDVRDDGRVLVLPSWFRESRLRILGRIQEMEDQVPAVRRARARGKSLPADEAAAAIARAPYDLQHYVDEAVVLRSELIGRLHELLRRQEATKAELARMQAPGLFDRMPLDERRTAVARQRRSIRLNDLTVYAIKDLLLKMETSALFPKDPRARALFKEDELRAAAPAPEVPEAGAGAEEVAEFESVPEGAAVEDFQAVEDFTPVEEAAPPPQERMPVPTGYVMPHMLQQQPQQQQPQQQPQQHPQQLQPQQAQPTPAQEPAQWQPVAEEAPRPPAHEPPPPPPPSPQMSQMPEIQALPDEGDATVHRMTLEEMAWRPPEPPRPAAPLPPIEYAQHATPPPPPPQPRPPSEMAQPQAPALSAPWETVPERPSSTVGVTVKRKEREKKSFKDRFGLGKGKRAAPAAAPTAQAGPPIADFEPVAEEVAEFESAAEEPQWGEPMPMATFEPAPQQPVFGEPMPPPPSPASTLPPPPTPAMPPPPSLPPPPTLPPPRAYAPARRPEDLDTVEEVRAAFGAPPPPERAPPPPAPVDDFTPFVDEVAEFEPEPDGAAAADAAPAGEERPLDAEKDIDKILAMALGKAPPPKTRPTARPGVREDLSSPISTLMSKTKYRPR